MVFGDMNLVLILFFLFFLTVILNVNTALHLLLTAELMWISLYIIVLLVGFIFDNVNILSLTFFFLIFSAAEFALGLVIILIQHIFSRSIYINTMSKNNHKFSSRFKKKLSVKSLII
jgi:NADH:ubiquinone oxidoreductase subunit K